MPSVHIDGVESLQERITSLPGVIGRRYMTPAMRAATRPLESELLVTTPMGPTGSLRRAVGSRVVTYATGVGFGVVGYRRAVSKETADSKGLHANLVEFGTNERTPKKSPFLSAQGTAGARPSGWSGRWPMVARRVRGSRALQPLGRAFQSVGRRCADILAGEMAAAFEKAAADNAGGGS